MLHGPERAPLAAAYHAQGRPALPDHDGERAGVGQRAEGQHEANARERTARRYELTHAARAGNGPRARRDPEPYGSGTDPAAGHPGARRLDSPTGSRPNPRS